MNQQIWCNIDHDRELLRYMSSARHCKYSGQIEELDIVGERERTAGMEAGSPAASGRLCAIQPCVDSRRSRWILWLARPGEGRVATLPCRAALSHADEVWASPQTLGLCSMCGDRPLASRATVLPLFLSVRGRGWEERGGGLQQCLQMPKVTFWAQSGVSQNIDNHSLTTTVTGRQLFCWSKNNDTFTCRLACSDKWQS